jgi:CRP-like cAMP-binding protein
VRPISEQPALAERACELLCTPHAMAQLTPVEATLVVAQMWLIPYPAGAVVFREGEQGRSAHLLLLLEGELGVDTGASGRPDVVAISVLGPGSIVGEMTLLDGAPRSATCTAHSPVLAAGLSRKGLERLIAEHPRVAAKLLVGLASRIAERLRALGEQIQFYAALAADQQREIDRLRSGKEREPPLSGPV